MKNGRTFGEIKAWCALLLCILQLVLVLLSWILAAAFPELPVRSLLSSEGIRWFLGSFTDNMQTPLLVCFLLYFIAYGAIKDCGILHEIRERASGRRLSYRSRLALWIIFLETIACVVIMFLLSGIRHAILLSATGELFPSSFSKSLLPVTAFITTLCAVTFGTVTGKQKTLADVLNMLTSGFAGNRSIWLMYILGFQLYYSALFVFKGI